ncbi:Reverse transcriptase domain [Cinara cedri]|uniref:Reverse transcriptase domain n=1 Tax=Cinara cedri TaxID=506608 RepID=A0A5E4M9G6_9HEMI|nr:Reverse transcriptase domain [Cinara cedri]
MLRLNPIVEAKQLIPNHQFGFRIKHSTIDQVHRVTNVISKALEEKNYCGVLLDVAQAFDKVWHKGLLLKLRKQLPHTWCALLKSYLTERHFRVRYEGTITNWKCISAGVPQSSVLGPFFYLLYTADIPTNDNTMIVMFADDTAILSTRKDQQAATEILQTTINTVYNWTKRWKIKINGDKSVRVNYTLLAKLQIKQKMHKLYWLIGRHSELDLSSERLLYASIVKPIWIYGIQLWGCASKSNIGIIQRCQSIALRTIVAAY